MNVDEATWDDGVKTPAVDWRMSAALENVPRGSDELAEVTNLEAAVRDWLSLDPVHQGAATLTPEKPILIDGVSHATFSGGGVAALAELLPMKPGTED